jgi:hypothetical protein
VIVETFFGAGTCGLHALSAPAAASVNDPHDTERKSQRARESIAHDHNEARRRDASVLSNKRAKKPQTLFQFVYLNHRLAPQFFVRARREPILDSVKKCLLLHIRRDASDLRWPCNHGDEAPRRKMQQVWGSIIPATPCGGHWRSRDRRFRLPQLWTRV